MIIWTSKHNKKLFISLVWHCIAISESVCVCGYTYILCAQERKGRLDNRVATSIFDACLGDLIYQSVIQSNMINGILSAFEALPVRWINFLGLSASFHFSFALNKWLNPMQCRAMPCYAMQCDSILIYMIVALRLKLFSNCLGLQCTMRLVASHRIVTMQMCSILCKNLH